MRFRFLPLCVPFISLLVACGTRPAAPPSPTLDPSAQSTTPARATLFSEQGRLSELFRGTPVTFTMQADGSMRATVPRVFSFDAGAIKVKPPLAAVLDRLSKSQLQSASRLRVSTPSDTGKPGSALARDRALSVRDYLMGQGIAPTRLQANGVAQTEQVEIVVSESAR